MRRSALPLLFVLASCTSAPSASVPPAAAEPPQEPVTDEAPNPVAAPTPAAPTPAPTPVAADGTPAPHFRLEWRRGSGAMFRDEISVADDGRFNWVAQEISGSTGTVHAISVPLTDVEVNAVRQAIDSADFFSLPPEPGPTTIQDGDHLSLGLRLGARVHRIRVEEPLPPGVVRIQRAIAALFTDARRAQLRAAGPPQPGELSLGLLPRQ